VEMDSRRALRRAAAVAAVRRWGLEVPLELLSVGTHELRSIPLAATDPKAVAGVRATVQRVIGALVVDGGETALTHVAWVDFDDDGEPVFPKVQKGKHEGRSTISRHRTKVPLLRGRRQAQDIQRKLAHLDTALKIYGERATAATGELVPAVLGDVAAYARAKAAALAEPGAHAAIAELVRLTWQVPQLFGRYHRCAKGLPPHGMARAKALARLADPHAPPPTMLAHAVHKQRRAVAGSKWLYETISKIATLVGVELVVLPGGVKKLPRTVFKCAVNYNCDLS
jgi:hypothetical protein